MGQTQSGDPLWAKLKWRNNLPVCKHCVSWRGLKHTIAWWAIVKSRALILAVTWWTTQPVRFGGSTTSGIGIKCSLLSGYLYWQSLCVTSLMEAKFAKYKKLIELQLQELTAEDELGQSSQRTVELDQQSVGRLSRMDALQSQAMAQAQQRRRDTLRLRS